MIMLFVLLPDLELRRTEELIINNSMNHLTLFFLPDPQEKTWHPTKQRHTIE